MMKKIIVIGLVVLLSVPAFSQIKFGIKAGVGSSGTPSYTLGNGSSTIEELKSASWGYHVGIFTRLSLGPIYLQPEAVFASNTYDYNVSTLSVSSLKNQTFNRLSIPVLLGVRLGPLRVNAGPAASIQIGSPKALINDPNFKDMYKGATLGYQAGVGIDLLRFITLDVRYAGSLGQKFGDSVSIGGQNFKLNSGQSSLLLSVGLMF